jgi:hypothetical protein
MKLLPNHPSARGSLDYFAFTISDKQLARVNKRRVFLGKSVNDWLIRPL